MVSILGSLGLLLAACSSGSANAAGSGSTSTTTKGAANASFTAYANCLKSHGVNFTGGFGGFGGGGTGGPPPSGSTTRPTLSATQRAAFTKAESACASLRPKFNGGGGAGSTQFAAYRNCLKLHGVTLPSGRGGFPGSGTSTSTTSTPKVQAAMTACASLRPKGGFGGGFPRSTTTTTS
jgi:hypothetical protein